ncbi:AAA family ATPase [Planktothrix paucivesiculata]|uniref:ATPase domain-containing protein n=1 Tax=Planktothrix paucivesiculata PCC 9631 TaxID=671071 RepID=A0A7Z9BM01_9CYAN|nr:ATP-binding protein [Planktothrix paucivesiculata]VXD14588.1 conserved membrane hypothetical protein [Planktothrix paucivesiculata PCC 9631]
MSSTQKPIPCLDLAPKLNRPLSLFNPLDYLRLLYWVFFFPQAIRWYVEAFGEEKTEGEMTWQKRRDWLRQNPIKFRLFLQGLLLTVLTPLLICFILEQFGFSVDWWSMAFGVGLGVGLGVALGVALGVGLGVAWGVVWGVAWGVALGVGVASGVAWGVASGVAWGVGLGVASGVGLGVGLSVGLGVGLGVASGVGLSVGLGVRLGVGLGVAWGVAWGVAIWRPEVWVIGSLFNLGSLQKRSWLFPRITPMPLPFLTSRLTNWLKQDWHLGLENANELLRYSYQFIPVVNAVSQVLAKTPSEYLIFRVSQLAEHPFDWNLVKFVSASLGEEFKFQLLEGFLFCRNSELEAQPRLDTPAHAAAAGFWYLHEKEPQKAAEAFAVVSSLLYGYEMCILAIVLTIFKPAKTIDDIATFATLKLTPLQLDLKLTDLLPPEPYLRPQSWTAIKTLYQVVEDINLIKNSVSLSTRSLALNRALGEIKGILDQSKTLPEAERGLIVDIAQNWQSALLGITEEIGNISITKKVINPYIIGDPVIGKQFVGRKDIINQLEELWVSTSQLQSVVLFGHRRMGKTSILRNISTRLDEKVKLAYINLLTVGNSIQGVGEVLMAIADSLSDTLQIPPPDDESLINLPYRTFERYLKQIETQLGDTGLIIALDEFEQIEELIKSDRIPKDFMGVLRGMVQMSPKIAFALAGLHTLEEMTEDYFNPFFASIIPIRVSFLERATCRYLLANPSEDFPLDYKPDALDYIYDLTAGQPYLVQLIGFLLVRRYNDQVFELGNNRDPMFTIADVDGIINQPEFYQNGRYYFTGVWQQAGEGSPGQQQIIKAIAPHPTGLDFNTLKTVTNLDPNSLQNALDTLSRHDVITETDNHWRIIVELFRRWVINSVKLNLLT